MKQPQTFTDLITHMWTGKRVTFRVHGQHGELRKPMVHRFEVPGGISVSELMAQNVTKENALLKRLKQTTARNFASAATDVHLRESPLTKLMRKGK
jgi:hypothetical protein